MVEATAKPTSIFAPVKSAPARLNQRSTPPDASKAADTLSDRASEVSVGEDRVLNPARTTEWKRTCRHLVWKRNKSGCAPAALYVN